MGDRDMEEASEIEAFSIWDKASCLASLPTTLQELFTNYPPPPSRYATYRARNQGKSQLKHDFDRSVKLLVQTLRPYPSKPRAEASEQIQRVYKSTINRIDKQRTTIKRKMQRVWEEDDDYQGDDYEEQENGQVDPPLVDPNVALQFYEQHVRMQQQHIQQQQQQQNQFALQLQLQLQQQQQQQIQQQQQFDQRNSQFLLQLAASPQLRRPRSAARAPTTPNATSFGGGIRRRLPMEPPARRVRQRASIQVSPAVQVPESSSNAPRVSTNAMPRQNIATQPRRDALSQTPLGDPSRLVSTNPTARSVPQGASHPLGGQTQNNTGTASTTNAGSANAPQGGSTEQGERQGSGFEFRASVPPNRPESFSWNFDHVRRLDLDDDEDATSRNVRNDNEESDTFLGNGRLLDELDPRRRHVPGANNQSE